MKLQDLPGYLEDALEYPADLRTVRREVGDVAIEAPGASNGLSVGTVLDQLEEDSFETAAELIESILANLPEEYVGRKDYSDRGGHVEADADVGANDTEVSF